MARTTAQLRAGEVEFLTQRHLGTLSTTQADGSLHVVAIAFTFDASESIVRVITSDRTQKVVNVERNGLAAVGQVDGRRWLSLAGRATIRRDADSVANAVRRYAERYRMPRDNPRRVVVEIQVEHILGSAE